MRICKVIVVVVLVLSQKVSEACGPGSGYGHRPLPKKQLPFVRYQHVPNVSENTIGASGPPTGRITRNGPRFATLVPNYNDKIIFVDRESNGNDRLMTQRCKDKLDTLSLYVQNTWPDVRLRVTKGWEASNTIYVKGNLHYEGRAVDFTTSDLDRTKLGRLARLAVESGFDWVYYESTHHIHASVRAEGSPATKYGGCFPNNALVTVQGGEHVSMNQLTVGQKVLSVDRHTGSPVYSEVIMMMDRSVDIYETFIEITTSSKRTINLTPNHLIYVAETRHNFFKPPSTWQGLAGAVFASDVRVGDYVYTLSTYNETLFPVRVTSLQFVQRRGVVAPLTSHGTLLVDGVIASCYGVLNNEPLAHAVFWPVRYFNVLKASETLTTGLHWYASALGSLAFYILPESMFRML